MSGMRERDAGDEEKGKAAMSGMSERDAGDEEKGKAAMSGMSERDAGDEEKGKAAMSGMSEKNADEEEKGKATIPHSSSIYHAGEGAGRLLLRPEKAPVSFSDDRRRRSHWHNNVTQLVTFFGGDSQEVGSSLVPSLPPPELTGEKSQEVETAPTVANLDVLIGSDSVADGISGASSVETPSDNINFVSAATSLVADGISGASSVEASSDNINFVSAATSVVADSISGASSVEASSDNINFVSAATSLVADSISGASSVEASSDNINFVSAATSLVADSISGASSVEASSDNINFVSAVASLVADSISGASSVEASSDNINFVSAATSLVAEHISGASSIEAIEIVSVASSFEVGEQSNATTPEPPPVVYDPMRDLILAGHFLMEITVAILVVLAVFFACVAVKIKKDSNLESWLYLLPAVILFCVYLIMRRWASNPNW
nr:zonadhesin-like isoform X1 [Ipomoea batatas]